MIDLSKHPCPWCDNTNGNAADGGYASCPECWQGVFGDDPTDDSAAAAWIALSEKVHGKQHDGPTVEVRIAVAVDQTGEWDAMKIGVDDHGEAQREAGKWLFGNRVCYIITATLPLPVAQEIKGRVDG
jgi:hypothetical protein